MTIYEAIKFLHSADVVCCQNHDVLTVVVRGNTKRERDANFQQISAELRKKGYMGPIQEA